MISFLLFEAYDFSVLNCVFGNILTDAGKIGDGEVTFLRLIVIYAFRNSAAGGIGNMMLMDDEVGNGCFQVKSDHNADGAGAYMALGAHIKDMRHIADLLLIGSLIYKQIELFATTIYKLEEEAGLDVVDDHVQLYHALRDWDVDLCRKILLEQTDYAAHMD